MKRLSIHQKKITHNNNTFTVYSTKNKKGEYCRVKFYDDADDFITDNIENNKPFDIIVENNQISYKEKFTKDNDGNVVVNKDGEPIINRIFSVNSIVEIAEYVAPDIDDDII